MKPFYYFCDNVEEVFEYRTFDINSNGLNDVPNNWVHHNAEAVFSKTYDKLTEDESRQKQMVCWIIHNGLHHRIKITLDFGMNSQT